MLILGDEGHYHGRFPWVTTSLLVINIFVFVGQIQLGEPFTNGFSLVPEEITSCHDLIGTKYLKVKGHDRVDKKDRNGRGKKVRHHTQHETQVPIKHYAGPFPIFLTLLTSMFMHGNVFHLIGNMWFLLIFGKNVECAFNHMLFLLFYLACGVAGGLAHVCADPHSIIPCLGASGAISGVMGAYVSIHPFNKIKIWLGLYWGVIEVPALVVIGLWFVLQYVAAIASLDEGGSGGGVAYCAHVGGFVAGFAMLRCLVWYLQYQSANQPEEPEPAQTHEDDALAAAIPPTASIDGAQQAKTGVVAGAPDPFATFLSVQTIRNMQQPK